MKKILAMAMIIGMVFSGTIGLCFGDDAETASADVTVTAILDAAFDISEVMTIHGTTHNRTLDVSDLWVTNRTSDKTIKVKNVAAVNIENSGWVLSSLDDVNAAEADSKYIYLSMENTDLRTGCTPSSGKITGLDVSKSFAVDGNVPEQSSIVSETEVAKLIVTVTVYDTGGSSTVDGKYDGYTIDELREVNWKTGSDKEIAAVIAALDDGVEGFTVEELMNHNGFNIGASRNVTITSSSGSTSTAQLVILDANTSEKTASANYMLTTNKGNIFGTDYNYTGADKKTASFIIGIENLGDKIALTSDSEYDASWGGLEGRTTVNSYFATLPTEIQAMFKPFETVTGSGYTSPTTLDKVSDILALPAEKEVTGESASYSSEAEKEMLVQFAYFLTTTHYVMSWDDEDKAWYLRTPYYVQKCVFPYMGMTGKVAAGYSATMKLNTLVFGCV